MNPDNRVPVNHSLLLSPNSGTNKSVRIIEVALYLVINHLTILILSLYPVYTPDDLPMPFSSLPEYYISDIVDFLINAARFHLRAIDDTSTQDIITCITVYISAHNRGFIKNPYLIAKCVEALYIITPPENPKPSVPVALLERLRDMIIDNRYVQTNTQSNRNTVFIRIVAGTIIYFEAYFPQKYFVNF